MSTCFYSCPPPAVQDHAYQYVYSKYLSQMANEPLLMLEIGLGCDMSYGEQ